MNQEQKLSHLRDLLEAIAQDDQAIGADGRSWEFGRSEMTGSIFVWNGEDMIFCTPGWDQYQEKEDFAKDDSLEIHFAVPNEDGDCILDKKVSFEPDWSSSVSADLNHYHSAIFEHLPAIIKESGL